MIFAYQENHLSTNNSCDGTQVLTSMLSTLTSRCEILTM